MPAEGDRGIRPPRVLATAALSELRADRPACAATGWRARRQLAGSAAAAARAAAGSAVAIRSSAASSSAAETNQASKADGGR